MNLQVILVSFYHPTNNNEKKGCDMVVVCLGEWLRKEKKRVVAAVKLWIKHFEVGILSKRSDESNLFPTLFSPNFLSTDCEGLIMTSWVSFSLYAQTSDASYPSFIFLFIFKLYLKSQIIVQYPFSVLIQLSFSFPSEQLSVIF